MYLYNIERVTEYKLLGVHVTSDLWWNTHVDKICAKASAVLIFVQLLKRLGVDHTHLIHFYLSAVWLILEYCSVIGHHGLTKAQSEGLETTERRAIRVVYPETFSIPYGIALSYAELPSLFQYRDVIKFS